MQADALTVAVCSVALIWYVGYLVKRSIGGSTTFTFSEEDNAKSMVDKAFYSLSVTDPEVKALTELFHTAVISAIDGDDITDDVVSRIRAAAQVTTFVPFNQPNDAKGFYWSIYAACSGLCMTNNLKSCLSDIYTIICWDIETSKINGD